jgi:hypothetical protein
MLFLLACVKFRSHWLENIFIEIGPIKGRIVRQPICEPHATDPQNTVSIAFVDSIIVLGRMGGISSALIQIEFGVMFK